MLALRELHVEPLQTFIEAADGIGRVISNTNPANNLGYEQTDGIASIYNGPNSAVVALTPFLTSSTGPGYLLETALANQASVSLPCTQNLPAE